MLLTGTFKRAIDDKLRIAIPKRLRDSLATADNQTPALYVAPGTDGSITIYTEESFSRVADQLSNASPTGKDVRAFSRLFFSQAESVELDGQGRVRIPKELAAIAGLSEEAVLIGVRDHMEVWDAKRWQEYIDANAQEYDELAEKALSKPT